MSGTQTDATSDSGSSGESGEVSGAASGDTTGTDPDGDGSGETGDEPVDEPPQGGEICAPNGWCWITPFPTGHHLLAIDSAGPDMTWAVGEAGIVMRLHGGSWTASFPTDVTLRAVAVIGPDDVWVGGEDGTLLHYDGQSWTADTTFADTIFDFWYEETTQSLWLTSVDVVARNDGSGWTEAFAGLMVFDQPLVTGIEWREIEGHADTMIVVGHRPGAGGSTGFVTIRKIGESVSAAYAPAGLGPTSSPEPTDLAVGPDGRYFAIFNNLGFEPRLIGTQSEALDWFFESTIGINDSSKDVLRGLTTTPGGGLVVVGSQSYQRLPGATEFAEVPALEVVESGPDGPALLDAVFESDSVGWAVGSHGQLVELQSDAVVAHSEDRLEPALSAVGINEDGSLVVLRDTNPGLVAVQIVDGVEVVEATFPDLGVRRSDPQHVFNGGDHWLFDAFVQSPFDIASLVRTPDGTWTVVAGGQAGAHDSVLLDDGTILKAGDQVQAYVDGVWQEHCPELEEVPSIARTGSEVLVIARDDDVGTMLRYENGVCSPMAQPDVDVNRLVVLGWGPLSAWFTLQALAPEDDTSVVGYHDGNWIVIEDLPPTRQSMSQSNARPPVAVFRESFRTPAGIYRHDAGSWTQLDAPRIGVADFGDGPGNVESLLRVTTDTFGRTYIHDDTRMLAEPVR